MSLFIHRQFWQYVLEQADFMSSSSWLCVEKLASHFHVSLWTLFTVLKHLRLDVPMSWRVNVFKNDPAWPFHGSGLC